MKDMEWIVTLLIELHAFCELNGLDSLSIRLADAIEEAAPMFRSARSDADGAACPGQMRRGVQVQDSATATWSAVQPRPRLVAINAIET